jgi:hypothetical protein
MPAHRICLQDIAGSRFAAHGDFTIWTEGDVLCYEVTGPFNLEWVQALGEARRMMVEQWKPQRRVGAIVHWKHSALMSPQALAAYEAGFAQFKQHARGPVALAWVADAEVEGMRLLSQHFQTIFTSNQTNYRLFDRPEPARAWVDEWVERAAAEASAAPRT